MTTVHAAKLHAATSNSENSFQEVSACVKVQGTIVQSNTTQQQLP